MNTFRKTKSTPILRPLAHALLVTWALAGAMISVHAQSSSAPAATVPPPVVSKAESMKKAAPPTANLDELRKAAWNAVNKKDWLIAIELWSQILNQTPTDNEALRMRGSSHAEAGHRDLALADGRKAIGLTPDDTRSWNSLCWMNLLLGDYLQARTACEKSVDLEASSSNQINLGHTWLLDGDFAEARRWYAKSISYIDTEQALKEGPLRDFEIFIERGWQVEKSREFHAWYAEEGRNWLNRKSSMDKLVSEAKTAEAKQDYARAIALREQRLPMMVDLYGEAHLRVREAESALIYTIRLQADAFFEANRFAEALPLYQRVQAYREKQPKDDAIAWLMSLFNVAKTLMANNQSPEAERYLKQATEDAERTLGKDHEITIRLAEKQASLYANLGKHEEALKLSLQTLSILDKQVEAKPEDIAFNLRSAANSAWDAKRLDQAKGLWERYIALSPNDANAHIDLSLVLRELKETESALSASTRAIELAPSKAAFWRFSCQLHNELNRPLEARPLCEKALSLEASGEGLDTRIQIGHTYLLAGDLKTAQQWYLQAMTMPDYVIDQENLFAVLDLYINKGFNTDLIRQAKVWFEPRLNPLLFANQQIALSNQKERNGDLTGAIEASRKALQAFSASLGKDHSKSIRLMDYLVSKLKETGQTREARLFNTRVQDAWGWSTRVLEENTAIVNSAKTQIAAGHKEIAAKHLTTRDAFLWQTYRVAQRRKGTPADYDPARTIAHYYDEIFKAEHGLDVLLPHKDLLKHIEELSNTEHKNLSAKNLQSISTILHLTGRFLHASEDVTQARKAWQRSIDFAAASAEGDAFSPLIWLGHSYWLENRLEEALDYYQQATTAIGKRNAFDNQTLFDRTIIAQSTLKALQYAGLEQRVLSTAENILAQLEGLSTHIPKESRTLLLQALINLDNAFNDGQPAEKTLKEKIAQKGLMLAETLENMEENRRWALEFLGRKATRLQGDATRRHELIGILERMVELDPEGKGEYPASLYNSETELAYQYFALGDEDTAYSWAEKGYRSALKKQNYSSFYNALQIQRRYLQKKARLDDAKQLLLEATSQGIADDLASSLLATHYEKNGQHKEALQLRLALHAKAETQPLTQNELHTPEERNLIGLYAKQQNWAAIRKLVAKHLDAPNLEKMNFSHVALMEWVADLDERLGNRENASRLRDKAQQLHRETTLEPENTPSERPEIRAQIAKSGWLMWFSPNGKWILTANKNRDKLDLWHRETGRRLGSILPNHVVSDATFLPDNRLVLGTGAGTLELWDTQSLQFKQQIYAHTERVQTISVSPDGKQLLSYDLNRIRLWQTDTLKPVGEIQPPWVANALVWLDNNHWLGCDGNADVIFRFSINGLQQDAGTNGCHSLQSLGNGQVIYVNAIGQPEARNGWNLEARDGLFGLENVVGSGFDLKATGAAVALATSDKIMTWRIHGKTLLPGPALAGQKTLLGISPDSRWLHYSNPNTPEEIEAIPLANQDEQFIPIKSSGIQTLGMEFSESGRELWIRTTNGLRVWNFETGSVSPLVSEPPQRSSGASSPPPESSLLWAKGRRTDLHWNQQASRPLIGGYSWWANAPGLGLQHNAAILPDGDMLTLRNIQGGAEVVRWQGDSSRARWLSSVNGGEEFQFVSTDGSFLLTSSVDSNSQVALSRIDLRTGRLAKTMGLPKASAIGLAQTSQGKIRGVSTFEDSLSYLQLNAAGDAVEVIEPLPLKSCAVSKTGRCEVRSARDAPVLAFAEFAEGWVTLWLMRPELPPGDKNRLVRSFTSRPFRDFALSADGQFLVVLDDDGRIYLNSAVNGDYLGQMVMFDNDEWAVIDAHQRFDATRAGDIQSMHWVVGMEPVALNQLKARYYEPGLIGKLMGFNKEPLRPVSDFVAPKLYPDVKLEAEPNKPLVTQVKLLDQGGGIGRVQILLNGKEVQADARGPALVQNSGSAKVAVDLEGLPLKPGEENVLEVVVWNREGYLASRGAKRVIMGPSGEGQAPPTLFAIISGISEYANPRINLNFSGKDAADIARALRLAGKRLFGVERTEISLLTDIPGDGALPPTRKNLQEAFANVAKRAKPNDLLVVYLAGHGAMSPGEGSDYYYLTREARSTDLTDPAVRDTYGVSSSQMTEWIKSIPSLKQVMVLDTCAAGGAVEKLTQARALSSDQVRALDRLKDRTGFHVLMGASADKVSYESSQFGQGLLTYAILQGMKGAALRDGEFIDVQTLFQHAADQVPKMAQSIGGIQRPIIASPRGTSFDIGQLKAEDKIEIPLANRRPMFIRSIFQDEIKPIDSIGLSRTINSQFKNLVTSARNAPVVFIDSDDLPGAFQLAGRYQRKGDQLEIRASIYQGQNELDEFSLTGDPNNGEQLSCRLIEATLRSVLKNGDKDIHLANSECQ